MNYVITAVDDIDKDILVELRNSAMRDSLMHIGRFDPVRSRQRFLARFSKERTKKIVTGGNLAGFYAIENNSDHLYLIHFYIHPDYQSQGLGARVLSSIKRQAAMIGLPIRLGALRDSRSNEFYKKHGFIYTHEEEWDIYYEFSPG